MFSFLSDVGSFLTDGSRLKYPYGLRVIQYPG